ncbi:MAG: FkbM family methyltransferase [Methanoregula sp.]
MTIKKIFFDMGISAIRFSTRLFGKRNQYLALSNLAENISPIYSQSTKYGPINFFCFGEIPLYRADTLLTKEPETIEWIETFEKGDLLWDIGANVGCYSLYAAKKDISVMSFEPSAANFFLLQKNIEINKFDLKVQAFCVAFNDVSETGYLNMSSIQMGGAINSFGVPIEKIDLLGDSYKVQFKQGMVSFSIDDFIRTYHVPIPNHIKIDVDGIEDKIIRGAQKTLSDPRLKSVLIEIDENQTEYNKGIIEILEKSGLTLISKKHSPMFDSGHFSSMYNCVFARK